MAGVDCIAPRQQIIKGLKDENQYLKLYSEINWNKYESICLSRNNCDVTENPNISTTAQIY